MNKRTEKYKQAIQKFEESGILQPSTQTRGLFNSIRDLFTFMSGLGERNQERILTIDSNMNSTERINLYNGLRIRGKVKLLSKPISGTNCIKMIMIPL